MSGLRVIDPKEKYLEVDTDKAGDIKKILFAKLGDTDRRLAGHTIFFSIRASRALEGIARTHDLNDAQFLRRFYDQVVRSAKLLGRNSWSDGRLSMISRDNRYFFTGRKTRRGVTLIRHFEYDRAENYLWALFPVLGPVEQNLDRLADHPPYQVAGYRFDAPNWERPWGLLGSKEFQERFTARSASIASDSSQRKLATMQRRDLEQLIVLPPAIRQRTYQQLLTHYRYAVDLRTTAANPFKTAARVPLTANVEPVFCGAALLSDESIRQEFFEAESEVRRTCTPVFLLDSGSPGNDLELEDRVAPLPNAKEIHIALFISQDETDTVLDLLDGGVRRCLAITPNASRINLRLFLQAELMVGVKVHKEWAKMDWLQKLDYPQDITVETFDFYLHQMPCQGEEHSYMWYVYPSHDWQHASHAFARDDRIRLLDCAMGRPVPADSFDHWTALLLRTRRYADAPWFEEEIQFLERNFHDGGCCSEVAARKEKCRCLSKFLPYSDQTDGDDELIGLR